MQPGSNQWDHGRFWSHSYSQRIFQDANDADKVHLITERAVYQTYTDTNSDGAYDEVDPASEYRTLEKTVSGWTLTDLGGTVTEFRLNGHWLTTTDRHGNAKTATYSGSDLMSVTMPDGRREELTYLNGKVRTITEVGVDGSTSRSWTYTWTGDDLTRIDRPDGTALEYLYGDPSHPGYLTRITLIGMDGVSERITAAFEYDAQGNTVKMWRGDVDFAGVTDSTYTDSGELETKTDARGVIETRMYDALDRLRTIDYPADSLDISYAYDDPFIDFSVGRLTEILRDGHAIDYEYDRFGRIIRDGELTFGYDKNSNRVTLGYPEGIVATYIFDYADRESTLTIDDGGGPQTVVFGSSYLPSGPLNGLTLGNGFTETRTFDSRYYPDSIVLNDGIIDVLSWDYTTDDVGNPTSIVDLLNAANNRTYGYQDYQYFLTQGDGPWGTLAWTYDKIGNRLSESRDGATVDSYSYVPNLAASGNSPQLDQITLGIGGVHDFSYDAIGDQTQADLAGNVIDRVYDDAGRMSRQERAAAEASTEFLYDGRGFLRRSQRQTADSRRCRDVL